MTTAEEAVYNTTVPAADTLVRLHLSESPFGASSSAIAAAQAEMSCPNRYPDPERTEIVEALAEFWGTAAERIVVANGSDELVLASALSLGDTALPGLVTAGTFPGYPAALRRIGRGATEVPLRGTSIDVPEFAARLPAHGIGYICDPHNPSGASLSAAEVNTLAGSAEKSEVPLVFDQAYREFAEPAPTPAMDAPILILRTFSKAYGLAALRIGYAIGPADMIKELRATLAVLPFSVNRPAQAAAIAALADQEFLASVCESTSARRRWFCAELRRRGRTYLESTTNFVAVATDQPALAQDALAAEYGILVRDAGLFGFPGYLRVSLGTEGELLAFLNALDIVDH